MLNNFYYCQYTYLHRRALLFYIKSNPYLTDEERDALIERAKYHDLDKMTTYLFMTHKDAHNHHVTHRTHHINQNKNLIYPSNIDYLECIFDCECAALTKPDKPLNAYDTIMKYCPDKYKDFEPYFKKLHMDASYSAVTHSSISFISKFLKEGNVYESYEEPVKFLNQFNISEDDILKEIAMYLTENADNVYYELDKECHPLCTKKDYEKLLSYYDENHLESFTNL